MWTSWGHDQKLRCSDKVVRLLAWHSLRLLGGAALRAWPLLGIRVLLRLWAVSFNAALCIIFDRSISSIWNRHDEQVERPGEGVWRGRQMQALGVQPAV